MGLFWNNHPHRRRPHRDGAPDPAIDAVFRAMREEQEGGVSPDLTDSVMRRLGYAKASARVSRWQRMSRWAWRAASTAAVLTVAGLMLWSVHSIRYEASRSESVEEVVRASLAQKSRWLGEVANGIQPRGVGFTRPDRDATPTTPPVPVADPALPVHVPHPSSEGTAPAEAPLKKV